MEYVAPKLYAPFSFVRSTCLIDGSAVKLSIVPEVVGTIILISVPITAPLVDRWTVVNGSVQRDV